jgi:N utilization substance protein B
MALAQQKFREIVLQLLYSQDIAHSDEALMTELMMSELAISKRNVQLAQKRVQKIRECLSKIDPLIASVSTSYDFERIQAVTKNILRLGVFELFYDDQIPHKVAIAEAIRLSRKFNTPESASFVNAVLDHLYQASQGGSTDSQILAQRSQALMQSEQIASNVACEHSFQKKKSNGTV